MGCCWSSSAASDERDGLSESAPLLSNQDSSFPITEGNADRAQQEALRKIVQKTADSLIDITSVRMLDKLQPDQIQQRATEYQNALEKTKNLKLDRDQQDSSFIISKDRISQVLASAKPLSADQDQQLSEFMEQLRKCLKEEKIVAKGELIAKLK